MLNLPFVVDQRANAEFMSPGGKRTKLPVLRVENYTYAEFEHILSFVELKGLSLTKHLTAEQKDDMRAHLCLVEQIFTNAEVSRLRVHIADVIRARVLPKPW